MEAIFKGIFDSGLTQTISVGNFLLCLGVSLLLGLVMVAAYMWKNEYTKSFLLTLAILPAATVLQLVAYYVATERGCDVDKPRNLAKSVTVE